MKRRRTKRGSSASSIKATAASSTALRLRARRVGAHHSRFALQAAGTADGPVGQALQILTVRPLLSGA